MKKTLSSPLVAAANNIVSLGSRSNSLPRFQRDFNSFSKFLEVEKRSLEKLKLPDKKKIKALASLNIASNFGRPGNLLGSLFSGALDLGGFVGNMFPGRGKLGKPQRPSNAKPPKPTIKGPRLKLGGMRAVGVGNALFAGLDFATGLAEGESVGKSAAGAGGALAGSLLGGAIGQALIPIPGLGFVVGSMAGSFLGGYAADRVYEGGSALKQKLAERLKGQEGKQKGIASGLTFKDTIDKFDAAVNRFEKGVSSGLFGSISQQGADQTTNQSQMNYEPDTKPIDTGTDTNSTGEELQDVTATGGESPGKPFSPFGMRNGTMHKGNDYSRPVGTPISLIQSGTVTVANMNYDPGGWGALIEIKHKDGSLSRYAHVSKINVGVGQNVEAGQVIGNTGGEKGAAGSGNSTGPHLHFEYLPAGSGQVDPTSSANKLFRFGGNVKVTQKAGSQSSLSPGSQGITPGKDSTAIGDSITNGQTDTRDKNKPQTQPTPAASPQMMQVPQMSPMVAAAPMNLPVAPQNIQYYTSYNQPGGGASVIMPIMMGGGGGGQQRPVFIPVGGGGGGGTVIMPGPTEGQVVNSLMKTMLLTNLSAT
jgi:murein DD-endopeptidase MepM/ murein hydrolase activator NlpD